MDGEPRDTAPCSGRSKDVSRNVIVALPVLFMLPFVAGLAEVLAGVASGPRVSVSATFAAVVAVFLAAFVAITHRRRPRAGALAACHALVWAPFIALAAWDKADSAIVSEPALRCGTGLMAALIFAVPVGGLLLLVAGVCAGAAVAQRDTDRALRTAAVGATGLALVAFAFAAPRMTRPDADTYLASLPVAGELHDGDAIELLGRRVGYRRAVPEMPPMQIDNGPGSPLPPPQAECQLTGLERRRSVYYPGENACPVLYVRTDPGHDLAVIHRIEPSSNRIGALAAFKPSTGELVGVSPSTVADRIGPPIGWTLGAALGGLAGAAFVFAAWRIRRRAAARGGLEAEHVGDGFVVLPDGRRVRVDAAAALPIGTVVLGEQKTHVATYRTTDAPTFAAARPGTLVLWRMASTDVAASLDAAAIAVAVLGATPLVVARMLGVL